MKNKTIRQSILLLLAAIIWGVAFVAQSVGMDYVGPFTFNAVRMLLGGLVLVPFILIRDRKKQQNEVDSQNLKILIPGGIVCGIILFIASTFQQIGILYTTVGKAGFITALYIVMVPILGIFLKKKTNVRIWIGVILSVAGLYLLCMKDSFSLSPGDVSVLLCALFFSFHILVIDYLSPKVDGVKLSCIQFFVCAACSLVFMLLFEHPSMQAVLNAWMPIGYAGILSCGVAYTLQVVGQKNMNPTVASLLLSMESVVSVLAGFVILHQILSGRELTGCVLMFAAIILVQLPSGKKATREE